MIVACVKWGDMYGADYVNVLFDMVNRNLMPHDGKFVCFTDDPAGLDERIDVRSLPLTLKGWWNKLYLFKDGIFQSGERIVFFDLDTLIVGSLDHIVDYDGPFALLRDFYRPNGYGSGVMLWKAGALNGVWEYFEKNGFPEIAGGDQAIIERSGIKADLLQDLFPGKFSSYKVDGFKKGAAVVCFHGEPKPHNCNDPLVEKIWCIGGVTAADIDTYCNVSDETLHANIRHASARALPWLAEAEANKDVALIVGGGPSLLDSLEEIALRKRNGQVIFALNNSAKTLAEHGISVDWQVIMDARPENRAFIESSTAQRLLLASQVDPSVIDSARAPVVLFHASIPDLRSLLPEQKRDTVLVGGGTTVLTRAMVAVHLMGYRRLHLFGVDSSFRDGKHHAYEQSANDRSSEVIVGDRTFQSCPWMTAQVNEFQTVATVLADEGSQITVHGDGLLPFVAKCMMAA